MCKLVESSVVCWILTELEYKNVSKEFWMGEKQIALIWNENIGNKLYFWKAWNFYRDIIHFMVLVWFVAYVHSSLFLSLLYGNEKTGS